MKEALARNGINSYFRMRGSVDPDIKHDMVVMWGYKPPELVNKLKKNGIPLLIMERGYLPDRMRFTSMGWNGLNRRATFPQCQDNGERFEMYWPGLLQPWREGGEHVLVCGQYPGDAALYGMDLDKWAQKVVNELVAKGEKVVFRPHPLLVRKQPGRIRWPQGAERSNGTLADDLSKAKYCVTYNSNTGVESVCMGVPTVTLDQGAMAWDVTSHSLDEPLIRPDRTEWAHQLAWCNWTLDEIRNGTAWEALRQVC